VGRLVVREIANNNQRLNREFLRWNEIRVKSFFFGIKHDGVGIARKPEDQKDTLLLAPGSRTRALVKHVLN
jgi:hypothetical protein